MKKNKILVTGWRPIGEYDTRVRPWVLVKCYDDDNRMFYTEYAVMHNDHKWYTYDVMLPYRPLYFFDVEQIPFEV